MLHVHLNRALVTTFPRVFTFKYFILFYTGIAFSATHECHFVHARVFGFLRAIARSSVLSLLSAASCRWFVQVVEYFKNSWSSWSW
jgi:hypothetical protein